MVTGTVWQESAELSSGAKKEPGVSSRLRSSAIQPALVADLDAAVELAAKRVVDRGRAVAADATTRRGQSEGRVTIEEVFDTGVDLDVLESPERGPRVPLHPQAVVGDRRII